MSTARRTVVILTLAVVAVTITMAGTASADPPPQANPSCFGVFATSPTPGGPGGAVGPVASTLGKTGTAGDVAREFVRPLQQARNDVCPTTFPFP